MDFSKLTDKQLTDTFMHLMYSKATSVFDDADWAELVAAAHAEMAKRGITVKEEDY